MGGVMIRWGVGIRPKRATLIDRSAHQSTMIVPSEKVGGKGGKISEN